VMDGFSQMGSGSLPAQNLPTRLLALSFLTASAGDVARKLRTGTPSVVTRVKANRVLIDPRTLLEGDEPALIDALIEGCT
jgi:L-seryl-tRNA(Ser) seleniumtransferase